MNLSFKLLLRNPSGQPITVGIEPYGDYFELASGAECWRTIEIDSDDACSMVISMEPNLLVVTTTLAP